MTSPLLAPSSPVLVSERGGPVVPPEILADLKGRHPALSLRYVADFEASRWAITWEWPTSDTRWSWVQSGDTPSNMAYDIIGYIPLACPLDQAVGYIERHLKAYPKEEIAKLHQRITHHNESVIPAQQLAEVVTATLDDVSRQSRAPKGRMISIPKQWARR